MNHPLATDAVVIERPGAIACRSLRCTAPGAADLVVEVECTGVSSGTEKLLWQGTMPAFPGLAYPLIPGYEAVGRVTQAGSECGLRVGQRVFVPGTTCYAGEVRGLFGATASRLVVPEARVTPVDGLAPEHGVLLALAATAMHALSYRARHVLREQQPDAGPAGATTKNPADGARRAATPALADLIATAPQLIVGHGVLGRLLARLCVAIGAAPPVVWDVAESRRSGARDYPVVDPSDDDRHDYQRICDVSGAGGNLLDTLIGRLARGGHLTLAGFYTEPVSFAFPAAFMREVQMGIAAEWVPDDLLLVQQLLGAGALQLDGLVSHTMAAGQAESAYPEAFNDPHCLKMILQWSQS